MTQLHPRLLAAVAAVAVVCGLGRPAEAAARGGPTGFQPADFTATSDHDWWLLGTVRCGRAQCLSILRSRDAGGSFTALRTPPSSTAQQATASQLQFADARDGWAFGPQLWSTHDGGRRWRQLQIGYTDQLAAADGYVYALVSNGGADQLMRSPVDRDRWRVLRTPRPPVSGLWVQGRTVIVESQTRALISVDAGGRFRIGGRLPTGTNCSFDATAGSDVFWALCFRAAADPGGQLIRSSDGGRTWHRVAVHGITPGPITGLAATSARVAVIAGYGGLYRTLDGGTTWSAVAGIPAGFSAFYLGFIDATHGVAIGGAADSGRRLTLGLYETSDAGDSYRRVPLA